MTTLLNSIISLVTSLFFLVTGILAMLLPWWPEVRSSVASFIMENSIALFFAGCAFVLVGGGIATNIVLASRRRYYTRKTSAAHYSIDKTLIQDYLNVYWQELFPEQDVASQIKMGHDKIEVFADFPFIPDDQHPPILERIQSDLEKIFSQSLQYNGEIILYASFQPAHHS